MSKSVMIKCFRKIDLASGSMTGGYNILIFKIFLG